MSSVKVRDEFWCVHVVPRFPRVVLRSKVFPFYQVPQFPVHHSAVQNFFHHPLFFSVNDFRRRRWWGMSTVNGDRKRWSQHDHIKDWVKPFHGRWEPKTVSVIADFLYDGEGSEMPVRQFF